MIHRVVLLVIFFGLYFCQSEKHKYDSQNKKSLMEVMKGMSSTSQKETDHYFLLNVKFNTDKLKPLRVQQNITISYTLSQENDDYMITEHLKIIYTDKEYLISSYEESTEVVSFKCNNKKNIHYKFFQYDPKDTNKNNTTDQKVNLFINGKGLIGNFSTKLTPNNFITDSFYLEVWSNISYKEENVGNLKLINYNLTHVDEEYIHIFNRTPNLKAMFVIKDMTINRLLKGSFSDSCWYFFPPKRDETKRIVRCAFDSLDNIKEYTSTSSCNTDKADDKYINNIKIGCKSLTKSDNSENSGFPCADATDDTERENEEDSVKSAWGSGHPTDNDDDDLEYESGDGSGNSEWGSGSTKADVESTSALPSGDGDDLEFESGDDSGNFGWGSISTTNDIESSSGLSSGDVNDDTEYVNNGYSGFSGYGHPSDTDDDEDSGYSGWGSGRPSDYDNDDLEHKYIDHSGYSGWGSGSGNYDENTNKRPSGDNNDDTEYENGGSSNNSGSGLYENYDNSESVVNENNQDNMLQDKPVNGILYV